VGDWAISEGNFPVNGKLKFLWLTSTKTWLTVKVDSEFRLSYDP
jgi:hypothetical protein